MTTSEQGIKLIQQFEGCKLESYQDMVGVWTIGFGCTGSDVNEGMTITMDEAISRLKEKLTQFEAFVNGAVQVPLSQNQFDALIDFTYNLGDGTLQRSTLLKLLNQKNYKEAAEEILKFDHAGGKQVAGLTRRRRAEFYLFSK